MNIGFHLAFIASAIVCPVALGQKLSFGVVGGVNLTDDLRTLREPFAYLGNTYTDLTTSDSRSMIFGAMLEVGLPRRWSLEVDALHRTLKSTKTTDFPGSGAGPSFAPYHTSMPTWQFPLLLKYRFPAASKVRPFVAAGPSFRTYGTPNGTRPAHYGITGGAGVDLSVGGFRIAPTLRYTSWAADGFSFRPTIRNQVELLVGLGCGTDAGKRRLFGERLWFGVVAGVPLTNDFHPDSADTPRYTGGSTRIFNFRSAAGLMVEAGVTDKVSLEVNGLYRRLHFPTGSEVVVTWEIPVLAKYKFSGSTVKPFVELGPSFRPTGNLNDVAPSHYGIAGGAGVEGRVGGVRFTPSVRYTRWAPDYRPLLTSQTLTKRDQLELLVGVSF